MQDDAAFDEFYGRGAYQLALDIINALAPVTRRDEWWGTDGPKEIIARYFNAIQENRPK